MTTRDIVAPDAKGDDIWIDDVVKVDVGGGVRAHYGYVTGIRIRNRDKNAVIYVNSDRVGGHESTMLEVCEVTELEKLLVMYLSDKGCTINSLDEIREIADAAKLEALREAVAEEEQNDDNQ